MAMLLVLLRPLDLLWDGFQNRGLSLCVYVDDIAVHVIGTETSVAATIVAAADFLVEALENDLSMVVSRRPTWSDAGVAKTLATVRNWRLAKLISTPMRRLGIAVKCKAKDLGVHFGLGGRTRELTSRRPRWAAIASRRNRVVKLGRKLGGHVFRTGLQPAALYGASVALPRLSTIRDMRRSAARTMGPLSGRSVAARLAVSKYDPSCEAVKRAIMAWVNARWDCPNLHANMARAWMQAQITVSASKRPSASVGGSASSFVAALLRVGWRTLGFSSVMTLGGTLLDLTLTAPRTVLRYLVDDFAIVPASSSSLWH